MSVNGIGIAFNVYNDNDIHHSEQSAGVISLEKRMIDAISTAAVDDEISKIGVFERLSDQNLLSSPEQLLKIQNDISERNIKISLTSALTKKAVDAVTTLISH
ncbi:type III secretion system inner rod subunit SctI [Citrobacter sp. wls826]|uniref:type III secretion system inner rod subunit SctI n=1 Tax=Citrobacter sp. wls826 TaxID=2576415 RepID=UPI0010C962C9|nr:type III secretion system inner rod subunit SctI [Citrobacter sp. wls826]TKU21994.1 hypothetical protein FDW87_08470 [Citrobacter sp. wls826]TKV30115.1 hypothetical protein FDX20_27240 [Citrobacter sp. TBCS-11]